MRKPIKICYILPDYDENNISHFYHLYEFLEKLSEKMDIFIIAEKSKSKEIKLGSGFYIQKFKFLPLRFLESFLILLKARSRGYKNFYTHYCYIGAINAGIISRLFGGKSYYWNCAMNWLFRPKAFSKLGIKLSLKLSHYLVTGGEIMKEGYAKHYNLKPEKIILMPNRINLERFQPQEKRDRKGKTLLFIHWLSKRKGADTIVPIMKHLLSDFKPSIPDFKLLVVGDGPYRDNLLREIKDNKLEKRIQFIGFVPNKNIVEYYKKADLFILPSMEEGFPLSLLESMAMGIPYVASDVGAVKEMSPEIAQRFLVKAGDTEMFVHKIETLLSDETIYEQFKREELEKVKEYSLDRVLDKFLDLFV